jgi:hypothetical protein
MATKKKPATPKRQPFLVDARKVKRVQKFLGVETETEAIEKALDTVLIDEKLARTHKRFAESGIEIEDVFGRLPK